MSKQQLTIEHLAPYLPYGVKVLVDNGNGKYTDIITGMGIIDDMVFLDETGDWYYNDENDFDAKLVLRPLSDLTKEILHNGKRFIPIELIGKLFIEKGGFYEGFFGWDLPTGGDDYQDYYLTIEHKEENLWMNTWCGRPDEGGYEIESHVLEYTAFLQLIKWHFDVFGLIEKGLAINLNEVK